MSGPNPLGQENLSASTQEGITPAEKLPVESAVRRESLGIIHRLSNLPAFGVAGMDVGTISRQYVPEGNFFNYSYKGDVPSPAELAVILVEYQRQLMDLFDKAESRLGQLETLIKTPADLTTVAQVLPEEMKIQNILHDKENIEKARIAGVEMEATAGLRNIAERLSHPLFYKHFDFKSDPDPFRNSSTGFTRTFYEESFEGRIGPKGWKFSPSKSRDRFYFFMNSDEDSSVMIHRSFPEDLSRDDQYTDSGRSRAQFEIEYTKGKSYKDRFRMKLTLGEAGDLHVYRHTNSSRPYDEFTPEDMVFVSKVLGDLNEDMVAVREDIA